jgi:hypothetical protein
MIGKPDDELFSERAGIARRDEPARLACLDDFRNTASSARATTARASFRLSSPNKCTRYCNRQHILPELGNLGSARRSLAGWAPKPPPRAPHSDQWNFG